MRLTHKVTMQETGRDTLAVEYNPTPDQDHDIVLVVTQDPEGQSSVVYLSHEQYDVIADLVWAHRPDSVIEDAEIATVDRCVFGWETGVGHKTCALASGHETWPDWTHISPEGWVYKAQIPRPPVG